jgi:predicted phage terminase large subunit-like protein
MPKNSSKLDLYQTLQRYKQNEKEKRKRAARNNILDYTRYTMDDFRESWHHRKVASILDEFVNKEIPRLILDLPPRHTKSEFVSRRLPSYILGKYPDAKIIACSYGADLASMMNRDVQKIMDEDSYHEVFPNTLLNTSNVRTDAHGSYLRNSEIFEIVGRKGVYKCAGVGGAITGYGMDYGIIDDPIKNRAEAESPTYREMIWNWYMSTFRSRKQKNACILITMTRWHEDDLVGRLLDLADKNPRADQWEVFSLPAITDDEPISEYDERTGPGQALWPDEFPVDDLLSTKASLTTYEWLSLYQQRPSAAAGNLVKKEHFKYCTLENGVLSMGDNKKFLLSQCKTFQTCDPAASEKKTANDFVLGTWVQTPQNDLALIDILKTNLETPKHVPLFKQQYLKHRPQQQWIETDGIGRATFQLLRGEGLPIAELKTSGHDKLIRFIPAATRITAGSVYFLAGAPWLHDYETELLGFPNTKQNGQVDVTSYACQIVIEHPFGEQAYETDYTGTSFSSGGMRI